MEAVNRRLRVVFEDGGILSKSQKKEGLKQSWVLLKPQLRTISDLVVHLIHSFDLYDSCPSGILLSMDGFVLPAFESTAIFKDKDLIRVKKKGAKLRDVMKAIKGVETLTQDEVTEKQLLPFDIKLLANEEYKEETGGYVSETDDGEDLAEVDVLTVENSPHGDLISKKRKASNKVESSKSKAKRRKHTTPELVQKKCVHRSGKIRTPEKKKKLENDSEEDAVAQSKVIVKGSKMLEPTSASKQSDESKEKREKVTPVSTELNAPKKVSRSTLRKRLKRLWEKERRAQAVENHECEAQPVKHPKTDSESKMDVNTNIIEHHEADKDGDVDDELVPVIIRPGHIRFTPSAKAKDVEHNPEANDCGIHSTENDVWKGQSVKKNVWGGRNNQMGKETFQWNGITDKRKGQKWGMEKQPTSSWKDSRHYDVSSSHFHHDDTPSHEGMLQEPIHSDGITNKRNAQKWGDEKQPTASRMGSKDDNTHSDAKQLPSDGAVDFEKLDSLNGLPKAGDIIAYRIVEVSLSWCPELSPFRVGKVSWFQPESDKIMLVPHPEYPFNLQKKMDDYNEDDDSGQPPDFSVYNEDGSLEIEFRFLVDVRVVKYCDPNRSELTGTPRTNGIVVPSGTSDQVHETLNGSKNVTLDSGSNLNAPAPENGKKDVWEEITEALSAKKAELTQEDGWLKNGSPARRSWSRRGSALGPIMERLRAQNAI